MLARPYGLPNTTYFFNIGLSHKLKLTQYWFL